MLAPGMRRTAQRTMVYNAIVSLGGHCTADEITAELQLGRPGFSRSTVYRALEALSTSGALHAVRLGDGPVHYEVAGEGHAPISETLSTLAAALMFASGAMLAYKPPRLASGAVSRLWAAGWGFDWLYDRWRSRGLFRLAIVDRPARRRAGRQRLAPPVLDARTGAGGEFGAGRSGNGL